MSWYNPLSWFGSSGNMRHQGYQNENPGTYSSESAAPVTFDTAMSVSSFWACTRILTETIGSMPIRCYKRMPDGSRQEDREYPLWRTLNYQPNRYQTKVEFFESIMMNLVTDGNAYVELMRTPRGISSFLPLMSSQMRVKLLPNGEISYEYTDFNSEKRIIPASNIWHIRLFGNSIVGMSPLGYARQSLGISIASDNRVGKLAKNGGKPSGILSIDRILKGDQRDAIRKNMEDIATGNSDNLKILEADMKYQQIGLSPQDLQLLESRRFSVEDIARFMMVPSVLINDTDSSTTWGSGIEQIIKGFEKLNLNPYATRIECSLKRNVMPMGDWDSYDFEFDFDSLLRPDRETRIKTNATAINSAQMTPNEARNAEGLPDQEGGDKLYINGSLYSLGEDPGELTSDQRIEQLEDRQNENDQA